MALQDSTIFRLPGRSKVQVPIVGTGKNRELSGISKATPEWVISIGTIFVDHVSNAFTFAPGSTELYGFSYNTARETVGHSVNQLLASSAVRYSDLIVIIQNESYAPILEQYMNNGTCIDTISITRWGWVNGQLVKFEERLFQTCYITQFRQIMDFLVLFIRNVVRIESLFIMGENGIQRGQVASASDATTGIVSGDL